MGATEGAVRDRALGAMRILPSRNVVVLPDGAEVAIPQKGVELLCHLADVHPGAIDGRELARLVWPNEPVLGTRSGNLRSHVSMVNRRLGQRLILSSWITARVRHPAYWLAMQPGEEIEPVHRKKAAA